MGARARFARIDPNVLAGALVMGIGTLAPQGDRKRQGVGLISPQYLACAAWADTKASQEKCGIETESLQARQRLHFTNRSVALSRLSMT